MIKKNILLYSIIILLCTSYMQNRIVNIQYYIRSLDYINKLWHSDRGSIQEITDISFFEENKEAFVYFARKSCPYCLKFDKVLDEVLNKYKVDIYLFDTDKWRNDYQFDKILQKYEVRYVPYFIKTSKKREIEVLNLTDLTDYENSLIELENFIISNK